MASTFLIYRPCPLDGWAITHDEPTLEAVSTFILGQALMGITHGYAFLTRQVVVYIAVQTAKDPVACVCVCRGRKSRKGLLGRAFG